jgi:uncharacterized protein (TIGR04255 family)
MMQQPTLSTFRKPPVIEVVASVQFEPLAAAQYVHFGLLWERFRKRFPKTESRLALPQFVERLGVASKRADVELSAGETPSTRVWFINELGDELVQVQADRFIRNWRAVPNLQNPYPRYEECIRPRFEADYLEFLNFVKDESLGDVQPNQCEISYINHIVPNQYWTSHADLGAVIKCWAEDASDLLDYKPEAVNLGMAYVLRDSAEDFLGRLHVSLQSAFLPPSKGKDQNTPIFVLTLTARGRPLTQDMHGVLGFLDLGRRAIVQTFDRLTTAEMHKVWEKIHAN